MTVESVKKMVEAAKAEIDNISPSEASRRANEEGALIVDIRDVREMQRDGAIPGAMHAPRGMLEFWERMNAASVSHGSWRSTLRPG